MEDRPWPEYKFGKPITAAQVARLLKPFGIEPRKHRIGADTHRGYHHAECADAFERYVPPASTPIDQGAAVPPVPVVPASAAKGVKVIRPAVSGEIIKR
jgi:hypothetical protein